MVRSYQRGAPSRDKGRAWTPRAGRRLTIAEVRTVRQHQPEDQPSQAYDRYDIYDRYNDRLRRGQTEPSHPPIDIECGDESPRAQLERSVIQLGAAACRVDFADLMSNRGKDSLDFLTFTEAIQEYEQAIRRAVSLGLLDHPAVRAWISGRRSLRQRRELRVFKNKHRFETGVRAGIDAADFWITFYAVDLFAQGYSIERVRRALLGKAKTAQPLWPDCLRMKPLSANEERAQRKAIEKRLGSKQNLQRRLALLGISAIEECDREKASTDSVPATPD